MAESTVYKIKGKTGIHAMGLSPESIHNIKVAFELFLQKNQSTIKPIEMLQVFEKIGLDKSNQSIYGMVKSLDNTYNNEIGLTFEEFMDQAADYFNQRGTREGISRIFSLLDT